MTAARASNRQHPIPGCPDYFITRSGAVWSHKGPEPRQLRPYVHPTNGGYFVVGLRIDGATKNLLLHRLLATTFIPNPKGLPEVNHKDLKKRNNSLSNLEWVTKKGNAVHAASNFGSAKGRRKPEKKPYKLNDKLVQAIRRRCAQGESQAALAREFDYPPGTISRIVNYDLWNWVGGRKYAHKKKVVRARGTGPTGNANTATDSEAHHRIPEYPDYRATASGVIWSYKRSTPSMMTPGTNNDGYRIVSLRKEGRSYTELVHRLVALALIPNRRKLPQVNHRNLDKQDNRSSNLEWATHSGNVNHSAAIWGREIPAAKPPKKQYKLNDRLVADIRRRSALGEKVKDLAHEYGVSTSYIYQLRDGKHYQWARAGARTGT